MKNLVLIILIAIMAGLGLYYYFVVGPSKSSPVTTVETSDLEKEMSQIFTDDTSVTLDVITDTAGL